MKTQRIEYYDFLRGIAIIMVVGIHTFVAMSVDTAGGFVNGAIRQLLNCAVPVFLALSGLFCAKKSLDTWQSRLIFWKKQIPKVYIPTLTWSLPYFILASAYKISGGGQHITYQIVALAVCGYSIYYFIALIIQYYLLLPLLQRYRKSMMICSAVTSVISILLITYFTTIKGFGLPLIVYAGPFTTWFVFFMTGVYFSIHQPRYNATQALAVIILGYILQLIEMHWLNTTYGGGFGIKLSSYIYSIGVVMLILLPQVKEHYRSCLLSRLVAYIGSISFGIYLTHCFSIQLTRSIIGIESWSLTWFITLSITSFSIIVARMILPERINRYLGFI